MDTQVARQLTIQAAEGGWILAGFSGPIGQRRSIIAALACFERKYAEAETIWLMAVGRV